MNEKTKLAMFDLDGTLFDTFEIHFLAYESVLKKRGYSLDREFFRRECFGKYYTQFLRKIVPQVSDEEMDEIHQEKTKIFDDFIKDAKPNYPLFDIIRAIKEEYYLAVVTSSNKDGAIKILKTFGVFDLFDTIVGGSDVERHKPASDCYELVRDTYGIKPENIIVFEDTKDGYKSAFGVTKNIYLVKEY
ncbi:MAG: HAD family phosphatase [Bacilli bacterium]